MSDTLCGDRISTTQRLPIWWAIWKTVLLKICISEGRSDRWWHFRRTYEVEFDPWTFVIPGFSNSRVNKSLPVSTTTYCLVHWKCWFYCLSTERSFSDQSLEVSLINSNGKLKKTTVHISNSRLSLSCSQDKNKYQRLLLKIKLKLYVDLKISQEVKDEEIAPLFSADQFGKQNPSLGHNVRKYSLTWFIPLAPPPTMHVRPLNFTHN